MAYLPYEVISSLGYLCLPLVLLVVAFSINSKTEQHFWGAARWPALINYGLWMAVLGIMYNYPLSLDDLLYLTIGCYVAPMLYICHGIYDILTGNGDVVTVNLVLGTSAIITSVTTWQIVDGYL